MGETICTFLGDHVESVYHLFVTCSLVTSVWNRIIVWLGVHLALPRDLCLVFEFFLSLHHRAKLRGRFILIWQVVVWTIWLAHNDKFFINLSSNAKELEDKCIFFLELALS